jgi:aminomethyltransferase
MNEGAILRKTALWAWHKEAGARLVPFAGYEMPVQYQGVIQEHEHVRRHAGIFDVAHMGVASVKGLRAREFLDRAVTRDLSKLEPGKAAYTLLCREDGGTVDDLIVYAVGPEEFWLVLNASNKEKDLRHLGSLPDSHEVRIQAHFEDISLIALQGPESLSILEKLGMKDAAIHKPFTFLETSLADLPVRVAFTGYTGEKGCEIFVASDEALALWKALLDAGARPCGLAARDTLRLEMGYSLYGHELLDSINPVEAGLSWAIGWKKPAFMGKDALERSKAAPKRKLVALENDGKQAPRAEMPVIDARGVQVGYVTSGSFSPTLGHAIALALVSADSQEPYSVAIRDKHVPFRTTTRPFNKSQKN